MSQQSNRKLNQQLGPQVSPQVSPQPSPQSDSPRRMGGTWFPVVVAGVVAWVGSWSTGNLRAGDWPQWRGPTADGVSPERGFPRTWSADSNILWKIPLPGAGNSSPVIQGDDLILTATEGRKHAELRILCFDRHTGQRKWSTGYVASPADEPFSLFPPERGHAASTPIITPNAIYALFGSGDLIAVDRTGAPLWFRSLTADYGPFVNDYGIAASPVLDQNTLYVPIDHQNGSYLLAVQATTGAVLWKVPRKGIYDNWSTPVAATVHGQRQIICLGTRTLTAYDAASGQVAWSLDGVERLCTPTPIVRDNLLYVTSGPGGANMAIDLAARPTPAVVWKSKKTGPFIPSAVAVGDWYLVADDQGTATCYDRKTGAELWRERIANGRMRPSPVAAEGYVYWTALDGTTTVIKAGPEYDPVATNKLGEEVAASAALAGGRIYLRASQHLYCIGQP